MPRAVTGSSGSYPTMASSNCATSLTVRAIGPICAVGDGYPSHIPLRLKSPGVGRRLTTSFQAPGRRIDASVSSPIATEEKFAVIAHPDPPDEPPTVRSRSYGLLETPNIEPNVAPAAYSLNVVFPRMIAPAF